MPSRITRVINFLLKTKNKHLQSTSFIRQFLSFVDETPMKDSRGLFSPRMDYDQWKPLGRGDPLQNDPTYDYVPPVLDRVHYWIEPPTKKQDSPAQHDGKKSEILVLGVSSKKPSSSVPPADVRKDQFDPFLKFIDGPKFYHHHHNSFNRLNPGQRPPHSMPHNFHSQFYKNKYDETNHKPDEQRMPYTVLVPPPMPPPHMEMPIFNSQNPSPKLPQPTTQRPVYMPPTATTAPRPSVSVQEANLIYHSSSTGGNNQWHNNGNQFATLEASSQYVTWRTPTVKPPVRNTLQETNKVNTIKFPKNSTEGQKSTSENKPFVFPSDTTGRIVFEQHSVYDSSSGQSLQTPSMHIQTGSFQDISIPQTPLVLATSSPTLHILHVAGAQPAVTHMAVGNQPMHKGQVSDDTIGNAYVNIGKPNAHIQKEITSKSPDVSMNYPSTMMKPSVQMPLLPLMYPNNQINSVYTNMNTPALINNGVPFSRRPGPITEDFTLQTMQTMQPPSPTMKASEKPELFTKRPNGFLQSILQKEFTITSPPSATTYTPTTAATAATPTEAATTTTAIASLTTDPLFKHYKQPNEPLRGPMYLIIQGHSKVKNYGASHKENIHSVSMAETNEIPQTGEKYSVKHIHNRKENFKKDSKEETVRSRSKGARTLKDLLESGIGSLDVKETLLGAKYEIGVDDGTASTEKYYKGIVESEELDVGERNSNKKNREKRQLEEFIPVVEDTVETFIYDYLKRQSEGSGVGAMLASAITSDSSEDYNEDANNTSNEDS